MFVARDPEYVLGLSIHALYPAFGLPSTSADSSIGAVGERLLDCDLSIAVLLVRLLDFPALLLTQVLVLLVRGFWTSQHFC